MTARFRMLDRLLEAAFRLRPGELRPTLRMFLGCLATVGAFIVGRSVRDTVFLTHLSSRELPQMYAWSALAVALSGAAWARLSARHRLERLLPATGAAFALSVLAARAALGSGTWSVYALYVWVEVLGSVTVIQFWSLANEAYDAREARRLFALIGAGGTLANVVVGFAVRGLAGRVGAENLLFLCAALLLAGPALVLPVARRARVPGQAARTGAAPLGPGGLAASPHLRLLAALTLFTFLATTFVDYQFKAAAAEHFGRDRDAMAGFFGSFFGLAGIAALAVQVAVTARVLERLGLTAALLVLPAFLGTGSLLALAVPMLWTATLAKGADTVFRYTVTDASSQLLYLPLPAGQRRQAKAFLDGVLKPGTIALAGLLLAAWRSVGQSPAPVAAAAVACVLAWMATLRRLRGEYLRSLRQNLRRRLLDVREGVPFSGDAALVLRRALSSGAPRDLEAALELLPRVPGNFAAEVGSHLAHPSPRVRRLACEALGRSGQLGLAGGLLRLLQDPEAEVRAGAAGAICALARDQAVRPVRPLLGDPDARVRAAAVAGLMRHGGLDGVLAAAEPMQALLASPAAAEREQAGRALAAIGARSFYQPVLALLADPDPSVQRTAVQAAAAMRSPELVPALVYRLARPETAQAAAEALAAYGAGTERLLAKVLGNPAEDPEVRRNAPRALGRLASPEAASVLLQHLDDPDAALRRQVDLALARLARLHPEVPIERERVRRACLVELERAYRALAAADALGLDPAPAHSSRPGDARATARHVLAWALRERVDQAAERACRLLSVLLPGADLELAQANLRDPSPARRASALEILDTVLDRRLERRLVPLLDGRSREAKLREGAAFFAVPRLDGPSWLQALLGDESPWIAAAALGFAAAEGLPVPGSGLEALLGHPAPYLREAAFLAALRLAPEAERVAAARRLAEDPYPPLRGRAATFARAAEATARKARA